MTALVTKEDIEGALYAPFLIPRISTLSKLLQQVTETLEALRCQNAGRGNATPETTRGHCLIVDPFN